MPTTPHMTAVPPLSAIPRSRHHRTVLTSRWQHLLNASWPVPSRWVMPHLPYGSVLDSPTRNAWVSLIAYQTPDVRVLGFSVPGLRSFPTWTLQTYVRRGDDHGVCRLATFVPSRVRAWSGRTLFGEEHQVLLMTANVTETMDAMSAEYTVTIHGRTHRMTAMGTQPAVLPTTAIERFVLDPQWGYGRSRTGGVRSYRLTHPEWAIYPVQSYAIDLDWESLFGGVWERLNGVEPESVVLAAGSTVGLSLPT